MKPQQLEHLKKNLDVDVEEMKHYIRIVWSMLDKYPNNFKKENVKKELEWAYGSLQLGQEDLLQNVEEKEDLDELTNYDSDEIDDVKNKYVDAQINYDEAVKQIMELDRKYKIEDGLYRNEKGNR